MACAGSSQPGRKGAGWMRNLCSAAGMRSRPPQPWPPRSTAITAASFPGSCAAAPWLSAFRLRRTHSHASQVRGGSRLMSTKREPSRRASGFFGVRMNRAVTAHQPECPGIFWTLAISTLNNFLASQDSPKALRAPSRASSIIRGSMASRYAWKLLNVLGMLGSAAVSSVTSSTSHTSPQMIPSSSLWKRPAEPRWAAELLAMGPGGWVLLRCRLGARKTPADDVGLLMAGGPAVDDRAAAGFFLGTGVGSEVASIICVLPRWYLRLGSRAEDAPALAGASPGCSLPRFIAVCATAAER
mmetsp:Transcript_23990/g.66656  ORF Transcript_23990/g.66656 Transcript_23990/m.66656 type:complete len:299 (+) Transcript_23990:2312-3208(+)